MIKNKAFLISILLAVSSLSGCQNSTPKIINLNVGTKSQEVKEIASDINLWNMFQSQLNDGFILATISKTGVESCGCSGWTTFREDVLNRFVKNEHVPVYYFNTDLLEDITSREYKINKNKDSDPELYLYQDGKIVHKYTYKNVKTNFFGDYASFKKTISEKINKPETYQLYYVDEKFLYEDSNLANNEESILLVERNRCGDCSYLIDNYLIDYLKSHPLNKEIYVFDIQNYRNNDGSTSEKYKNIVSKLNLSKDSNPIFGYDAGYVPTLQYYQKEELKDAMVIFNDTVEKDDNGDYIVTNSYYTLDRLPNLNFLNNSSVTNKILLNMKIDVSELDETRGYMWKHESAIKKYSPIIDQFIETYCL